MSDPVIRSRRSEALVSPQWLQEHLADPDLRIIDCSAQLVFQPVGPSKVLSGLPAYLERHIPGARYINMASDLSDPLGPYPFTMPGDAQIEALLGRLGISPAHRIVLYGHGYIGSVTRVWYVLHAAGHRQLALLDGGFERWLEEGRPVQAGHQSFAPEHYTVQRRPEVLSDALAVQAAIGEGVACLVNALSREQHQGTGGTHYGRPGRIPGSVNAPARDMIDPQTRRFLSDEALRAQLAAAGVRPGQPVISYCGGGIAATVTAFVLNLLGHDAWSVYDHSLNEWANRHELPMDRDPAA